MKVKNIVLGILATLVIVGGLTACQDKNNYENFSGENSILGENKQEEMNYNNGGSFVLYKGKTYFREYNNASIEKVALLGNFDVEKEKKTSKYINAISSNGRIENIFKDSGYGDFYILDDRFYFQGYQNKLYSVNMQGEDYREICKGNYIKCDEKNHEIYYTNSQNNDALYKINTQNLRITKISDEELLDLVLQDEKKKDINENINFVSGDWIYSEENEMSEVIFSNRENEEFQNKYLGAISKEDVIVKLRNIEKVDNKLYFLVEMSKHKPEDDSEDQFAYERIASEMYTFDLSNGRKTLIYLYKVTDRNSDKSGNSGSSADNDILNGPLAENEMYLEIRLTDKGLKETFDIRVEEVGGMIIGKRIEYEGTHSRSEEILKIKVTKEIGAMLNVYIDDKLDSQMLIED